PARAAPPAPVQRPGAPRPLVAAHALAVGASGPATACIHAARADPKRQIRSLVLCVGLVGSRPIWPAHVHGSPIPSDPDESYRIVRMIKRASDNKVPGAALSPRGAMVPPGR